MQKNFKQNGIQTENYNLRGKIKKHYQPTNNNKNKNNGVLYEALANIKRSHSRSITCE